jgi:hypothetical protein
LDAFEYRVISRLVCFSPLGTLVKSARGFELEIFTVEEKSFSLVEDLLVVECYTRFVSPARCERRAKSLNFMRLTLKLWPDKSSKRKAFVPAAHSTRASPSRDCQNKRHLRLPRGASETISLDEMKRASLVFLWRDDKNIELRRDSHRSPASSRAYLDSLSARKTINSIEARRNARQAVDKNNQFNDPAVEIFSILL